MPGQATATLPLRLTSARGQGGQGPGLQSQQCSCVLARSLARTARTSNAFFRDSAAAAHWLELRAQGPPHNARLKCDRTGIQRLL